MCTIWYYHNWYNNENTHLKYTVQTKDTNIRFTKMSGLFVRIEAFSALHANLSCLHQLVNMLSRFEQRIVRETLRPSCIHMGGTKN